MMISKVVLQNELNRVVISTEIAKLQRIAQMVSQGATSLSAQQQSPSAQSVTTQTDPLKGNSVNHIV
jgi:hypothetical protein